MKTIPMRMLCQAELQKIRGRGLAAAVLLFGLLHGVIGPGVLLGVQSLGQKVQQGSDWTDWLVGADLALYLAVFPVNGFVLLLLAALVFSEDFALGTMAMIFARPVHRGRIFLSKILVCLGMSLASLCGALILGCVLGLILLGTTGDLSVLAGVPVVGWIATAAPSAADTAPTVEVLSAVQRLTGTLQGLGLGMVLIAPIVGLAALLGATTRSPVMTLFGSVLVLVGDAGATLILSAWASSTLSGAELAATLSRWTLWSCRDLYALRGSEALWTEGAVHLASAGLFTGLFLGLASLLFIRRDVT